MSEHLTDFVNDYLDHSPDPEVEAITLYHSIARRFGWAGTFSTRGDAESILERELTDEEWLEVQRSYAWRKAGEIWNESGITWDTITEALSEAGLTPEEA